MILSALSHQQPSSLLPANWFSSGPIPTGNTVSPQYPKRDTSLWLQLWSAFMALLDRCFQKEQARTGSKRSMSQYPTDAEFDPYTHDYPSSELRAVLESANEDFEAFFDPTHSLPNFIFVQAIQVETENRQVAVRWQRAGHLSRIKPLTAMDYLRAGLVTPQQQPKITAKKLAILNGLTVNSSFLEALATGQIQAADLDHFLQLPDQELPIEDQTYPPIGFATQLIEKLQQREQAQLELQNWLQARRLLLFLENPSGQMALHIVAQKHQPKWMQALLAAGAAPNTADGLGLYPLHLAVCSKDPDSVQALLRGGANPKQSDLWGATPLHYAAWLGAEALCAKLVQAGASPKAPLYPDRPGFHRPNSIFIARQRGFTQLALKLSKAALP